MILPQRHDINATLHDSLSVLHHNMAGIDNAGLMTSFTSNLQGPSPGQFPVLTTPFKYAASCGSQWLQLSPSDAVESSRFLYFSFHYYATYFKACQPEPTKYGPGTFSPGVCPSGYYIAAITEYNDGKGGSSRSLGGMCCGK
jgi:hypothetical protein